MHNQMTTDACWHGTPAERLDFLYAIAHNCECQLDDLGVPLEACASHRLLASDQRALDGLVFARYLAERLRRQELDVDPRALNVPWAVVDR
jgi:hypothetical protein